MPNGGDVVIVGGGVMGCASALELAKAGAKVIVLERSVPGAEASSAAAGILGAQVETAEGDSGFELARQSRARYPAWAEQLKSDGQGLCSFFAAVAARVRLQRYSTSYGGPPHAAH